MPRMIKTGNPAMNEPPVDPTEPSARNLASGFSTFNPTRFLRKYQTAAGENQARLLNNANVDLQQSPGEIRSRVGLRGWLTGVGAALVGALGNDQLSSELRPLLIGIAILGVLFSTMLCGGVCFLAYLLVRSTLP